MKLRSELSDEMTKTIQLASDRIRYYQQQDKMLQSEIRRLTRNERTHRLCTHGGMVETFIQEPEKLTDDQVMELLTVAFRQPEVSGLLQKNTGRSESKPLARRVRAQLYTVSGAIALSEGSCRGLDGEKVFSPSQGTLHFPCAAVRLPFCTQYRFFAVLLFHFKARKVNYMPCPHFKITITQRSRGQSAVAGAAYQSGEKLFSEYDLKWKSYAEKQGIVYTEIMLPTHAPPEYSDRNTLWNSAEKIEKQWNSQLARRIVLALPREVPADQYPAMLRDFCREHFVSHGMCVDYAIHDKGDGNPHVHIMLTMRAMDEHGKWLPKSKKVYDLDENGERIWLPSGNWRSHKEDTVDWNDQSKAEIWRHGWEVVTNEYLERNNRPERVDLRSFERQGIDLAPTIHLGPAVTQMEKRGIETDMGNINREIKQVNRALLAIRKLIADLQSWIAELREKRNQLIEEKREPTLPEMLTQYLDARRDERSDWSVTGRRKGTTMDLKKVSHAVVYLQEHVIGTKEELQKHLDEKQSGFNDLNNQIRDKEKRMRDIQSQNKAWDSVERLLPIHHEYIMIGWKGEKEKFYQAHKAEIDEYNRAFRLLIKLYPDKKVPINSLKTELEKLTAEIAALKPELESVKADLDELKTVRAIISPLKEEPQEIEEGKTATTQAPKEKASLVDRLHDKQKIVDEQEKNNSHSCGYEPEL